MAAYQSNSAASRTFLQGVSSIPAGPAAPAGTFLPGTKVQVGNHRVVIDKYLSEGGFAHVYVVSLPKPIDGVQKAVLKRVAVPDKEHLANMRTEVETMKRLRGHKHIVKYFDSHASSLKNGGYEVFLLMEWCDGGGLIDFMNTRLQNRLTEPEIVKIFTDVAEGVACMHYLKPALMHRDLKIENVLISMEGKTRTFKLCDFGSAAIARSAATSAAEGRLIEGDVQRHTTLQYRSPEMVDVYRKQAIDEKSDIWALGCFLYKLCYYTTPFEQMGQNAILNAQFKYPGYPKFSDDLKLLIASMLQENPARRPNIYQVLAKSCKMDGRPLLMKDIYTNRSQSEGPKSQTVTSPPAAQAKTGATLALPKQEPTQLVPQVEPMRRGRPLKPMSHHNSAKPSPSPLRMLDHSDAFADLDGNLAGDELSGKFPKLEEFSLMNDDTHKFAFQPTSPKTGDKLDNDLAERVTQALADDAFIRPASPLKPKTLASSKVSSAPPPPPPPNILQKKRSVETKDPRSSSEMSSTQSARSDMISKGVGSSPPLLPQKPQISNKPIWKIPEKGNTVNRSASITQASSRPNPVITKDKGGSRLANLLQQDAAKSQASHDEEPRSPTSSRPSLEGARPAMRDLDSVVTRSRSLNAKHRPVSVNLGARPTHINDREIRKSEHVQSPPVETDMIPSTHAISDSQNIQSDIEFLRAREEEEREKHKHRKRLSGSGRHQKRASLPAVALSGTKNLLQGRFGEAFRKFESHSSGSEHDHEPPHSPNGDGHHILTPIAGSEATDLTDDRGGIDETEELSPELKRELEKQKLEAEERRVERAAAEYRQRIGAKGSGPPSISAKAASIQNRVQSLLNQNEAPTRKTATGYGRFTAGTSQSGSDEPPIQPHLKPASAPASAIDLQAQSRASKPLAPPKPQVLRTGTNDAALLQSESMVSPQADWEESFSKKYPDLSHFDSMEISGDRPEQHQLRMREV